MDTPAEIRTSLRAARNFLPQGFCHEASERMVDHFVGDPRMLAAKTIAAYCAIGSEANPMSILAQRHALGIPCYLPMMTRAKTLLFGRWSPKDTLVPNRFGIPQPGSSDRVVAEDLEVIVVPLVAFDKQGNRLGTGGGYYDRSLSFLLKSKRPTKPWIIGAAFGMQQVDVLPVQQWDVPLDSVVTEDGWIDFN